MSKLNESSTPNKGEKSSKLIIISKDRIRSARNKNNLITLKEGTLKYTIKLSSGFLDKNSINKAIKTMKRKILINSRSYGELYENLNLNKYIKNRNNVKTPNKERDINSRKSHNSKRKEDIIIETNRSYNIMKTTENNKDDNNENEEKSNKLETIIPYNTNREDYINIKINDNKKNLKQIIVKNNEKNNNINNDININDIDSMKISEKSDDKKNNNNNYMDDDNIFDSGLISKNFYKSTKNNKINKEKYFEQYKSEEIKQINSNSSRNNVNTKNNQRSDKAAKSISEQEQDNKTKIVSKSILTSERIFDKENNKEANNIQRLITEYVPEDQYINDDNNDLISESKDSKTIKIEENNELHEEENNKNQISGKINNHNDLDDKNDNILNINENKDIKDIFNHINKINIYENNENQKIDELDKNDNLIKNLGLPLRTRNGDNNKNKTLPLHSYFTSLPCSICEQDFQISSLFVAECQTHFLCKKCTKNYYEDLIENGIKEMLCPFIKCRQPVYSESLEKIISKEHFNILINNKKNNKETQNKFYFTKLKSTIDNEHLKLYTKKHVIDINSNKNLYNYNYAKEVYCPDCYTNSLFSKTNTFFYKCLNCGVKICKSCFKEFNEKHMEPTNIDHCKVYYRTDENEKKDLKLCYNFSLQLFFVLACYYLCFPGTFLILRNIFFYLFCIKNKRNIFLYLLAYLFTIIFFIIVIPFIVLFYPYFPSIIASCDY